MRMLVIEAETRMRSFLARAFDAEGWRVDAVDSGRRTIDAAISVTYDLAVLDLSLGDEDGYEMLGALHDLRPALPILVLSDRRELAAKLRAFELGAVDYLAKPFALEELIARTRVQGRRVLGAEAQPILRVGELELDVARREARIGEMVIDLPDREFRLLHFLMAHPGEVVSRQRLLSEVWGYDFDPRSNVVDVCVRRLRRQLGAGAPIRTVRRAGYRAIA